MNFKMLRVMEFLKIDNKPNRIILKDSYDQKVTKDLNKGA